MEPKQIEVHHLRDALQFTKTKPIFNPLSGLPFFRKTDSEVSVSSIEENHTLTMVIRLTSYSDDSVDYVGDVVKITHVVLHKEKTDDGPVYYLRPENICLCTVEDYHLVFEDRIVTQTYRGTKTSVYDTRNAGSSTERDFEMDLLGFPVVLKDVVKYYDELFLNIKQPLTIL